jgi:hypothetical protein
MKRMLITSVSAAGLICGIGSAAHATQLQCSGFHQATGYAGRNPPETAVVSHEGGYWSIHYALRDGMTVERRAQFDVTDVYEPGRPEVRSLPANFIAIAGGRCDRDHT